MLPALMKVLIKAKKTMNQRNELSACALAYNEIIEGFFFPLCRDNYMSWEVVDLVDLLCLFICSDMLL